MYTQTLFAAPILRISSPLSPLSVPSICISPAADACAQPDSPLLEPLSPDDALSPRSVHLLPPPILSPLRRTLPPSVNKAMDKKGLDKSTFEDLLVANRERTARRAVNPADRLRREVVVKAHHSKQVERRALFLSRITAPPSPHSTETAVTPPESPAVFHFTLPSPGLASPLELFETVRARSSWVEQVDYNTTNNTPKAAHPSRLPSLDQITARLRPTLNSNVAIPNVVVEAPRPITPAGPLPSIVIGAGRMDEVKPRSRLPDSIRASTRARSVSPPTPTIEVTPPPMTVHIAPAPVQKIPHAPSQLIIPSSPPKSIKPVPVLLPQSIPALRINNLTNAKQELAPVSVMSWRDRCEPTQIQRKDSIGSVATAGSRKEVSMGSWKDNSMGSRKDTSMGVGPESWRECAWREREVPIKREVVRTGVPPISPRTVVPLPIGVKPPPPIPSETRPKTMNRRPSNTDALVSAPSTIPFKPTGTGTLRMDVQPNNAGAEGIATSRRSALWRVQKDAAGAVKLTESERRAVQGRNMVDKLRRRISAPAELEGRLRRGAPVGGF